MIQTLNYIHDALHAHLWLFIVLVVLLLTGNGEKTMLAKLNSEKLKQEIEQVQQFSWIESAKLTGYKKAVFVTKPIYITGSDPQVFKFKFNLKYPIKYHQGKRFQCLRLIRGHGYPYVAARKGWVCWGGYSSRWLKHMNALRTNNELATLVTQFYIFVTQYSRAVNDAAKRKQKKPTTTDVYLEGLLSKYVDF